MINFSQPELLLKHGTWVRVQLAFYDFIFLDAINLCPTHFREEVKIEGMAGEFADGSDLYERSVKVIEGKFKNPDEAWAAFVEDELGYMKAGKA